MWQILSKFSRETEIDSECVCVCVCVCVGVCVCIQGSVYYEELAFMTIETERIGKASGEIPSESLKA